MDKRYLPNVGNRLPKVTDPPSHLIKCLETVTRATPPKPSYSASELGGLYWGPTALAYLLLHLSLLRPNLLVSGKTPKQWAEAYLDGERTQTAVLPERCGIMNEELAFRAVSAASTQDLDHVQKFLSYIPLILTFTGSDEWLEGRCGFLYMLRLIRSWVPSAAPSLQGAMTKVIDCILTNGPPWIFRNTEYYGTGHGALGIITQIVLCDPSRAPKLESKLDQLLDLQGDDGNFPKTSHMPLDSSRPTHCLVQWCHGSPGFTISLLSLRSYFPALQSKMDSAIAKARQCTWEQGLLKKSPNLCHGIVGNALSLEKGSQRDHFLAYTTDEMVEKGDVNGWWEAGDYGYKYCVGCGVAGRAWGWMDSISDVDLGYIVYNDV